MRRNDIRDRLKAEPFRPFRMQITDGSAYEIRHPELCIPTLGAVFIGIPQVGAVEPVADRVAIVSLIHIVKVEFTEPPPEEAAIPPANPNQNGTQSP